MSVLGVRDPQGNLKDVPGTPQGDIFVASRVFYTNRVSVPGIGAASAYAAGDAFGTLFIFDVPTEGTISNVVFLDHDDEGITKELYLSRAAFTGTADNSAFAVSDDDLNNCVGVVLIDNYSNFNVNQVGWGTPALSYKAPEGRLWCQLITRGVDNIAAGAIPDVWMVIV